MAYDDGNTYSASSRPSTNQEYDEGSVSLKVDPTILAKAHVSDISTEYDSEGMCLEE